MHRYITEMAREHFPAGGHRSYSLPADLDLPKAAKAAQDRDTTYADTETGKTFRRLVMQLLYASYQARPDIAAAVGFLTRVQAYPNPELLKRAQQILLYLTDTTDLSITYKTPTGATDYPTLALAPRVEIFGASDASFDAPIQRAATSSCTAEQPWPGRLANRKPSHFLHSKLKSSPVPRPRAKQWRSAVC